MLAQGAMTALIFSLAAMLGRASMVHMSEQSAGSSSVSVRDMARARGSCPAEYPTLVPANDFITGDVCTGVEKNWRCPKGCEFVGMVAPFCQESPRFPCRKKKCWPLHNTSVDNSASPTLGNFCETSDRKPVTEAPPQNCNVAYYSEKDGGKEDGKGKKKQLVTGDSHSRRRSQFPSKVVTPCRVPDFRKPVGLWMLAGAGTLGVKGKLDLGVWSRKTRVQATPEEVTKFAKKVEHSVGFDVTTRDGHHEGSVSLASELGIKRSLRSTLARFGVAALSVECPETFNRTEYLYQWVVQDKDFVAKTEHIRCHMTGGIEDPPQCPPLDCGEANPLCQRKGCIYNPVK